MRVASTVLALVMATAAVHALGSDVYDVQAVNDNSPATTRSELSHGTEQWHDLAAIAGVRDEDWYRIRQQPYASYEIVVDSASGDLGSFRLARMAPDGVTILQQASGVGLGFDRSLRFANDTAAPIDDQYIVVRGAACSTACGSDDVYRIRMTDTTVAAPRFNNTATQITVLLLQNPASYSVTATAYFWNTAGGLVASQLVSLPARAGAVVQTQTIAAGMTGTITITHNARHGDLAGKTTALEPATGFSFDTPIQHKPR